MFQTRSGALAEEARSCVTRQRSIAFCQRTSELARETQANRVDASRSRAQERSTPITPIALERRASALLRACRHSRARITRACGAWQHGGWRQDEHGCEPICASSAVRLGLRSNKHQRCVDFSIRGAGSTAPGNRAQHSQLARCSRGTTRLWRLPSAACCPSQSSLHVPAGCGSNTGQLIQQQLPECRQRVLRASRP